MTVYKPIIGLEVHIELSTKSKLFCGCSAEHFGVKPNTNVCPVCMGLPGALPYTNKQAVEDVIKFGLALKCKVNKFSKFDRKHYFYPDLPKSYQISQYDIPFCVGGKFEILNPKSEKTEIRITRVHLEEDTGKLVHKVLDDKKVSLIDFNRSSVPLMELVTEPDFRSIDDVVEFAKELQKIVRYLKISTADMEKGSMRIEANVSVAKVDSESSRIEKLPEYKTELKNINSFKFMQKAVLAEIDRQENILAEGKMPAQETRGYDETTGKTFSQRSKEDAQDYRYFPDADLPPFRFSDQEIKSMKSAIPELPVQKRKRFDVEYSLSAGYIRFLTNNLSVADYFEKCVALDKRKSLGVKTISSAMVNQKLHEKFEDPSEMIKKLIEAAKVNYSGSGETEEAVTKAIANNPKTVEEFRSGKEQVIGFFIGQVQKILMGKGDVDLIRKKLLKSFRNPASSE